MSRWQVPPRPHLTPPATVTHALCCACLAVPLRREGLPGHLRLWPAGAQPRGWPRPRHPGSAGHRGGSQGGRGAGFPLPVHSEMVGLRLGPAPDPSACLGGQRHADTRALPALQRRGGRACCGVTTGQLFCAMVGSQRRSEYTVFGNAINLRWAQTRPCLAPGLCSGVAGWWAGLGVGGVRGPTAPPPGQGPRPTVYNVLPTRAQTRLVPKRSQPKISIGLPPLPPALHRCACPPSPPIGLSLLPAAPG